MKDLFEKECNKYREYTVFQDESWCEKSNFFYHGFLFIRNNQGRRILNKIISMKEENNRRWRDLSFKDIQGVVAKSEEGRKASIVQSWLELANVELQKGSIKFYLFGVNKTNIKNFWLSGNFNKNIYLRFFELGLKSSVGWFGEDKSEARPLRISHLYYERGSYNDERKNKVKWLDYEFFRKGLPWVFPSHDNISELYSNEKKSGSEFSNFIQFTDIILGACKYSFIKIPPSAQGKQQCVDGFIEIIERFNNKKSAYNIKSKYYKNFCINFFPTKSDLKKKEFLERGWDYAKKAGGFYCNRLTYKEQAAQNATPPLSLDYKS